MARVLRHPRVFSSRKSAPYTLVLTVLLLLSVVLLMLLGLGIFSLPIDSNDSPKGTRRADIEISNTDGVAKRGKQWTELLSWEPRAFVYHNFLSKEECEHLIELGKPHMTKSTVVDSSTGKSKDIRVRTSSGTFLSRGLDKTVTAIEKRIADFSFIPVALYRWGTVLQQRSHLRRNNSREKSKLLHQAKSLFEEVLSMDSDNQLVRHALLSCISELKYNRL